MIRYLAAGLVVLAGCRPGPAENSRYLYVWAGTSASHHEKGANFLAILNADPASPTYGEVIGTVRADSGLMPHHTEFELTPGRPLFANDFHTGTTYLIDHSEPLAPRVMSRAEVVPAFRSMHSFARLGDSLVLATFQFGDSSLPGNPGGLVAFNSEGRVVRSRVAADPAFPGARIRPYGLTLLPEIDRALTTSSPMDSERTADVIQVWRLSDLTLLRTIPVPGVAGDSLERYPFEVRTLADGRVVMMNSYYCGLYRISGLDGEPKIELVHSLREPLRIGCSVPLVLGRYWIMPVAYGHTIVTLDLEDPARPRVVSELATDSTFYPHWLGKDPGSNRIVVTDQGDGPPRVLVLDFDPATGRLSVDERFRDRGATAPGVSFARESWPGGITGPGRPHAALFVP